MSHCRILSVCEFNILGQSSLCWAFSSASMLRRSLKDFFDKHKDLNLTSTEQIEIENWLMEDKFHLILRGQITMNPIPKRIKKGETAAQRNLHERHYIKECSERVSHLIQFKSQNYYGILLR